MRDPLLREARPGAWLVNHGRRRVAGQVQYVSRKRGTVVLRGPYGTYETTPDHIRTAGYLFCDEPPEDVAATT